MHTFRIVQAQGRWTIEMGNGMTAPCKSREAAIEQAGQIAQALRCHGEAVSIVPPECVGGDRPADASGLDRLRANRRLLRVR